MTDHENPPFDRVEIGAAISGEIAAIHAESYATPVTAATTHVLDDLVVALLDIELTAIEKRMIEFGRGELVHELRGAVQAAQTVTLTAAIEHATGRRVVAFSSQTHLDPPFVAELFRLDPLVAEPTEPR